MRPCAVGAPSLMLRAAHVPSPDTLTPYSRRQTRRVRSSRDSRTASWRRILAVESESIRHGQIRPRPSPSRTSHQHRVCFDDVDMSLVDEAHVQTCFGSSQDIIGATETGYLLFYEEVEWGSFGDPPTSTPPHGG